eukprot:Nitzschia sp. Nitz4//scaffold264_size26629//18130//19094//NITZ4_008237-RA/size26629-augustus-gene-0.1-mRNA-1//1//CDS//3329544806//1551//frame0
MMRNNTGIIHWGLVLLLWLPCPCSSFLIPPFGLGASSLTGGAVPSETCRVISTPPSLSIGPLSMTTEGNGEEEPVVEEEDDIEEDTEAVPDEEPEPEEDNSPRTFLEYLKPVRACIPGHLAGSKMSYIGDAVFSLFVRSRYVYPELPSKNMEPLVVSVVRAESQEKLLDKLKAEFPLSDEEQDILRRGRNSAVARPRKNHKTERAASAFEALVGYLFMTDEQRCQELFEWLDKALTDREEEESRPPVVLSDEEQLRQVPELKELFDGPFEVPEDTGKEPDT